MLASWPSTLTPCTTVDDAPTGSLPGEYLDSAIDVIESIVTSPPRMLTPFTRDSECAMTVEPSKRLAVTDCTEPELNNETFVPGSGSPGRGGSFGGNGTPVDPPPGTDARCMPPIAASVDDVPSVLMIACPVPPSADTGPCGSPN